MLPQRLGRDMPEVVAGVANAIATRACRHCAPKLVALTFRTSRNGGRFGHGDRNVFALANGRCPLLHTDLTPIALGSPYGYKSTCMPTLPIDRDRGHAIHQLERRNADLP